jgi:hypothetical protein
MPSGTALSSHEVAVDEVRDDGLVPHAFDAEESLFLIRVT